METKLKQHQIRTGPPVKEGATPRMPHERDESEDSQASEPRRDIKQAYQDLMDGQVDTDLRESRGVDTVVNNPPPHSPVNPVDAEAGKGRKK